MGTNSKMKFTIAIACLLGLTSAFDESNLVQRLSPIKDVTVLQMEDSESESDEENVMTEADKVIEKNPIYNAWESVKDGAADGKYERVLTPHFSADSDDIFMRSMLTKYAHEKRTSREMLDDGAIIGGEPTGSFWMSKKDMFRAAKEVLGTHKGLSGDKLSSYLDTYFDRAWDNF